MSQPYRKHAAGVIQEHDERECTACASSRDCCRPQWRLGYHGAILRVMLINRLASLWDIKNKKDRTSRQTYAGIGHSAPVRTCAKQEQAQGAVPGQIQNRTARGATTSGRTTKQKGEAFIYVGAMWKLPAHAGR